MDSFKRWMLVACLVVLPVWTVGATYHPGDRGEDITAIQNRLEELGYRVGADGVFGPATEKAIRQFQTDRGLDADGLVGPVTYKALIGRDIPVSRGDFSSMCVRRIISAARACLGVPYVFGGTSMAGFDCSGFVQYVANMAGMALPRMADEQYQMGHSVSRANLEPGDLVFFTTYEPGASHSGIYLGYGRFISATSSRGVAIDNLDDDYWAERYLGARRLV